MFAAWLHNLDPFIFRIGDFGPRWYGLSYVLSGLAVWWLYRWLSQRGYTPLKPLEVADFITFAGFLGVLLGGRLGWILIYGSKEPHEHWYWMFEVWKGGMASHGGILGLVIFTWFYARKRHVSWTGIGDSLCVVAPVGLFLVRCANFINGELYGKPTNSSLAVQFPGELYDDPEKAAQLGVPLPDFADKSSVDSWYSAVGRLIEEGRNSPEISAGFKEHLTPRHPSQLYEAFLEGVLLFTILWILRTRFRMKRGILTGLFFILYALFRIIGETFRVPDGMIMGLSTGQFYSLFMFAIGSAFIWNSDDNDYEKADEAKPPPTA